MNKEQILELIIKSVKKTVAETGTATLQEITFNSPLYGRNGVLDSLGLVQLIADLEEEIYQSASTQITIADERAMSMKISPFRSVSSLADYVSNILTEQNLSL